LALVHCSDIGQNLYSPQPVADLSGNHHGYRYRPDPQPLHRANRLQAENPLHVSASGSAIIDNIAFTATMLSIIAFLNQIIPGAESRILWWSLALEACLEGTAP
jgi:hypothetical protein